MMKFELKKRDAAGRICQLSTKHGSVTTPALLPVINPNKIIISPGEMKQLFGTEMVITNSYIILKTKDLREKAIERGVHNLIEFDGVIMTDSGTFQAYVYGDVDVDPLEIVEFQREIGSDIGTILDIFGRPDQSKTEARQGVKETISRAKASVSLKGEMNLACPIQGSIYPDVREYCARKMNTIDADVFPIGGVVPLMENQRYRDLVRVIIASKKGLPPGKPVHLFGAGHPLIFPLAAALGCDLFDSSAYVKYAQEERLMFPWGTLWLKEIEELPCSCPVCTRFSPAELRSLEKKEKTVLLAKHNLYVSTTEIKRIRNAIAEGSLWELVEQKARVNPYLLDAMKELQKKGNKIWLERFEVTSKNKAMFYTGNHTLHRPLIYRVHQRLLHRYQPFADNIILFPEGKKPYTLYYADKIKKILNAKRQVDIIVDSSLGPVPIALDEMYPFGQSVFPQHCDPETRRIKRRIFERFMKNKRLIPWNQQKMIADTLEDTGKTMYFSTDFRRIVAVADMQFGRGASNALFDGEIRLVKSKNTGRIRNVYCNEKHVLSLRASDGMFTMKLAGAQKLHRFFSSPCLRVIIKDEAIPFVKQGKSVFTKFVENCDPDLRPFDECLIVDKKDELLAVGRCLLNREEMLSFTSGQAVKIREYIP